MTPNKRRKTIWIAIGLLLIASSVFWARPTYRSVKLWRARKLAAQALVFFEDKAYVEAINKAHTAYNLSPKNEDILRTLGTIYLELGPAQAVDPLTKVVAITGAVEDRKRLIEAALKSRRLDEAKEQIDILIEEDEYIDGEVLLSKARYYALRNDFDRAFDVMAQLVKREDAPEEAPLFYYELSQLSPFIGDRATGLTYLRMLAEKEDALGLEALKRLITYSENTPETTLDLARRIKNHPLAEREDKLVAFQYERKLSPEEQEVILGEVETLFETNREEELKSLGRWLNQQRLAPRTLDLISREEAFKRKDIFLIWLDAMAYMDNWVEIEEAIKDPKAPLEGYLKMLFEARIHQELGREEQAQLAWDRLRIRINNDPQKLWYAYNYASRIGRKEEVREILKRLTDTPNTAFQAYQEWIAFEQIEGNTKQMEALLLEMVKRFPNDATVLSDWIYLRLLMGKEIDDASLKIQEVIEKNPPYLAYRITWSMSYWVRGRHQEALAVLDNLDVDWIRVRARWQLVYALALQSNAYVLEAQALANRINPDELLPEERTYWEHLKEGDLVEFLEVL